MLYFSGVVRSDLPAMLTPRMGQYPPEGQLWAADNGRFNSPHEYTDDKYLRWLTKMLPYADRCMFATAPDVVGNARATLAMSEPMLLRIQEAGYPVALVAQDGLVPYMVPWGAIDALFIGGTTEWKLSHAVRELVTEAKQLRKWVHMGRVNSLKRLRIAHGMGCDSADGTVLQFDPKRPVGTWVSKL